jgi:hypothetical protein
MQEFTLRYTTTPLTIIQVNATGVAELLSAFSLLGLPLDIGGILGTTGALIGSE